MQQQILTTAEAAAKLRIHPNTLTGMARRGEIAAVQIGTRWRFPAEAIEKLFQLAQSPEEVPEAQTETKAVRDAP